MYMDLHDFVHSLLDDQLVHLPKTEHHASEDGPVATTFVHIGTDKAKHLYRHFRKRMIRAG